VVVDLRTKSPTWGQWISVELSRSNGRSILIPEGCAHGFQSLEDDSELCYMISNFYVPESARGVRWNDPAIRISWPIPDPILSERDGCWPLMPRLENPLQQALELARWQEAKPLPGGTRE
jgi:dTDP-4-dehydrorhamnose 3,5-epimerase